MMEQHEADQLFASMRDMAVVVFEYHKRLKEQGFNDEQAMKLTCDFQIHMLNN